MFGRSGGDERRPREKPCAMPGRLKDARLRLHVACEPGWRDAVVAAAAAEGESLSAYVRTAVDARLSGRAAPGAAERAALDEASRQLRGAGRNLNRLAMLANIARRNPPGAPNPLDREPPESLGSAIASVKRAAAAITKRLAGW